jgi:hypothetical protein
MAARVLLMPACLTAQSRLSSHCCSRNQTLGVSRTIQRVVSFQVNAAWAKAQAPGCPLGHWVEVVQYLVTHSLSSPKVPITVAQQPELLGWYSKSAENNTSLLRSFLDQLS